MSACHPRTRTRTKPWRFPGRVSRRDQLWDPTRWTSIKLSRRLHEAWLGAFARPPRACGFGGSVRTLIRIRTVLPLESAVFCFNGLFSADRRGRGHRFRNSIYCSTSTRKKHLCGAFSQSATGAPFWPRPQAYNIGPAANVRGHWHHLKVNRKADRVNFSTFI